MAYRFLIIKIMLFIKCISQDMLCYLSTDNNLNAFQSNRFFLCNYSLSSSTYLNKYRLAETYIPKISGKNKIIKLNFNIFQKSDGTGNFTIDSISEIVQIYNWVRSIFLSNPTNSDPPSGTNVVNLPNKKIDFILNGIYFYQDDFLYTASCNHFSFLLSKIKQVDSTRLNELNICITNGSYSTARGCINFIPTVSRTFSNVCGNTGTVNKYISDFNVLILTMKVSGSPLTKWTAAQNIAHEVGHALGLGHTYCGGAASPEGLPICDTSDFDYLYDVFGYPPDCPHLVSWSPSSTVSPSDKITNNLMGGNMDAAYLSPKQIGQCHRSLYLLTTGKYTQCTYDSLHPWIISNSETWDFSFRSFEDIWVKSPVQLDIYCTVQLTDNAHFIVDSGATVNVHPQGNIENRCGCQGNSFDIAGQMHVYGKFNIPPNSVINIYPSGTLWVDTLCINENVTINVYNGGKIIIKGKNYTNEILQYNNYYNRVVNWPVVAGNNVYAYNQIETQGQVAAFNTTFQAGRRIILRNGFKGSGKFVAKIDTMINNCEELKCFVNTNNTFRVNLINTQESSSLKTIGLEQQKKSVILPNPANTSVLIQSDADIHSIIIHDISGKILLQKALKGETSVTLDMSNIPNGLYFVQIETEEGVVTEKLVVQH